MTTTCGLLILLAIGPQLGQSLQPVQPPSDETLVEIDGAALIRRKEFTAETDGAYYAVDADANAAGQQRSVRRLAVDASGAVSPSFFEQAVSTIRKATSTEPSEHVDTVDLCGQTCRDVLDSGVPCRAVYVPPCEEETGGFEKGSELYDICPYACPPETGAEGSSLVWLWVLLGIGLPLCSVGGLAYLVLSKGYSPWKWWANWTGGSQSYESYEDDYDENEEEEEEEADDSYIDDAGGSQSNAGQSSYIEGNSASSSQRGTTVMPGGTTMMPGGASATTMMPGGASATTMMPGGTTMMPGGTTMMPGGTTMMPSSTTMMEQPTMMGTMLGSSILQEQPTMMAQPTMMEQPTMMGTMLGSSMLGEQPTMVNMNSSESSL